MGNEEEAINHEVGEVAKHIESVFGKNVNLLELAKLIDTTPHKEVEHKYTIVEVVTYTFVIGGEEHQFTAEEIAELKEQIAIYEELFDTQGGE